MRERVGPDGEPMIDMDYVNQLGLVCPVCGDTSDIHEDGQPLVFDGGASQEIRCDSCGARWKDEYLLTGYTLLSDEETLPRRD